MSSNGSLFIEIKKKGHRSVTFGDKGMGKIIGISKICKIPLTPLTMFISLKDQILIY